MAATKNSTKPFRAWTLRQKLRSWFLIVALIPMLVILIISLSFQADQFRKEIGERLKDNRQGLAIELREIEDRLIDHSKRTAVQAILLGTVALNNRETLEDLLSSYLKLSNVHLFGVFDKNGKPVLILQKKGAENSENNLVPVIEPSLDLDSNPLVNLSKDAALESAPRPHLGENEFSFDDVKTDDAQDLMFSQEVSKASARRVQVKALPQDIVAKIASHGSTVTRTLRLDGVLSSVYVSLIFGGQQIGILQQGFLLDQSFVDALELRTGLEVALINDKGEKIVSSLPELQSLSIDKGRSRVAEERIDQVDYLFTLLPFGAEDGFKQGGIAIFQSLENLYSEKEKITILFIVIFGVIAVGALLISSFIASSFSRPLLSLAKTANSIACGNFNERVRVKSEDEIGQLANSFNEMTSSLQVSREALVTAKEYTDNILKCMLNSLIVVSQDGNIQTVNAATCALLGYQKHELIGQPSSKIFSVKLPTTGVALAEAFQKGVLQDIETTYLSKDGHKITVWFSCTIMHDHANNLEGILCVAQDISEHKKNIARSHYLANYDPLTDLPNRILFMDRLNQTIHRSIRRNRHAAIMMLDLDRFKNINDTLSHAIGDLLLQTVSERLRRCVRESDTIARFGGDEFAFILDDIERPEDVSKIAKKVLQTFEEPMTLRGHELFITTSIGISLYPTDGTNAESLLKNADTAMYRAKEQGRNNYQHFSADMDLRALEYLTLETNLRHALERGEMVLHYQPMVETKTGKIIGAEALVRWIHPDLGLIPPLRFIPLAEETGLIEPIGNWVLKTACTQNKAWQNEGYPPMRVAVNLSARQFQNKMFSSIVNRILMETQLDPSYLELELTESIIMKNAESTIETLREFNGLGIDISIDDFGTGYSSLNYLKRFPVNTLKIDRSFVRDIASDPDDAAITRTVIAMGHNLNLKIVAEGVETVEQLEFLREMQCDTIQGYYFSKPLPAEELTKILKTGNILPQQVPDNR